MQQHDDIDNILMKRAPAPKAPAGLAERIIFEAVSHLQQNPRIMTFWGEIMSMIALPHPRVAVAAGVFVGLMVGLQASDGLSMLQQDWSSFLVVNEGGWL